MTEAGHSTWRRVHVRGCAGFNWAVVRGGGSSASASQVEGEQGSHCSEHYGFSIVAAPPPAHTSAPFHQAKFGLIRR